MVQIPEFTISYNIKQKASERVTIKCADDIANLCRTCMDADKMDWVESMIIIGLNKSNKVLGFYKVSSGGVTGTVCDPKVVLQFALLSNSCSIVLCHNHPSGSTKPSGADEELTAKIKKAAAYFDVKILDHIILSSEGYFSFVDDGIL